MRFVRLDIEVLCTLIRSSGVCIDLPEHKGHMDDYFQRIKLLSQNKSLSARIRFKLEVRAFWQRCSTGVPTLTTWPMAYIYLSLFARSHTQDLIELRENNWEPRRKEDGPKTLREIHKTAIEEDQRAATESQNITIAPTTRPTEIAKPTKAGPTKGYVSIKLIDETRVYTTYVPCSEYSLWLLCVIDRRSTRSTLLHSRCKRSRRSSMRSLKSFSARSIRQTRSLRFASCASPTGTTWLSPTVCNQESLKTSRLRMRSASFL